MPTQRTDEDTGRKIDTAEPSEADTDATLPADQIPGQSAQEPLKTSQKHAQDDESPGAL